MTIGSHNAGTEGTLGSLVAIAEQASPVDTGEGQPLSNASSGAIRWDYPPRRFRALAVVEEDEEGMCAAFSPSLPGAAGEGRTPEEALESLRESMAGCIEEYLGSQHPIPWVRDPVIESEAVLVSRWIDIDA